jgi:hypothetical protein
VEPFDTLITCLPGWTVALAILEGVMGFCDIEHRTIWVDMRLTERQRRSTIMHEAVHALRGDRTDDPAAELAADIETARRLVPIEALVAVMTWGRDLEDVLDALDVDDGVLRTRIYHLSTDEQDAVRKRLTRTVQCGTAPASTGHRCLLGQWWYRAGQPEPSPCRCQPAIAGSIAAVIEHDPDSATIIARPLGHGPHTLPSLSESINRYKEAKQWA